MTKSNVARFELLTPSIISKFRTAIETKHFADGRKVTDAQIELMLEAVICYEEKNVCKEERIGFLDASPKCKTNFITRSKRSSEEKI